MIIFRKFHVKFVHKISLERSFFIHVFLYLILGKLSG